MNEQTKQKLSEILGHAVAQDRCVIEFTKGDSGQMMVADITEHVEVLEDRQE